MHCCHQGSRSGKSALVTAPYAVALRNRSLKTKQQPSRLLLLVPPLAARCLTARWGCVRQSDARARRNAEAHVCAGTTALSAGKARAAGHLRWLDARGRPAAGRSSG